MTMIAFALYGDHAELITDSASYTANGSALSATTKAISLPHLDAAVLTQGNGAFGTDATLIALQVASQLPTFDQVVDEIPTHLRSNWQRIVAEANHAGDALVFLVGYSERLGRFTAWSMASDRDHFKPLEVTRPYVMPCPWGMRPDLLQARRFRAWEREAAAYHRQPSTGRDVVATWMQRPELPAPESIDQWVTVAQIVREERAESDYANIYVAGDVFHTRLGRGEVTTQRIHTYDDNGDGFFRMISGTQHPIAQLMPCPCGSEDTYLDCCLAPALDQPCGCHSGATLRSCCAANQLALQTAS